MSSGILSVNQVCDAIWGCQQAEEVVPWLKTLQSALLKDPLDSYDPSEAFLAIQGAALRFHPSQHTTATEEAKQSPQGLDKEQNDSSDVDSGTNVRPIDDGTINKVKNDVSNEKKTDEEIDSATAREKAYREFYWTIAEESLWAAASLACVCVGPAWRFQLYQRRLWLSLRGKQSRYTGAGSQDDQSTSSFSKGDHRNNASNSRLNVDKDIASVGSYRSFSPPLNDPSAVESGDADDDVNFARELNNHSFPSIPEVLPAAMLRFASSSLSLFPKAESLSSMDPIQQGEWIIQQKTIAIAQRYLVLALCCESPNMMNESVQETPEGDDDQSTTPHEAGPKSTEWTIPGAHELVGDMLDFWLRAAETPPGNEDNNSNGTSMYSMDWWYTLRVARASTDLVSTGWRPLPKTNIGSEVVHRLLDIAEKGFSLLDYYDGTGTESTEVDPTAAARLQSKEEEKLAASSSAAETISALASLGSRGLIPVASQQSTARVVCRLHVISGAIRMSASGHGGQGQPRQSLQVDQQKSDTEQQIFMSQIESCFADTADFLWILFANQASASNTSKAFLEMVKAADYNSPSCALPLSPVIPDKHGSWNSKSKLICMEAGTAVRMMSAAAWGRPPDVVGIPHLRNYWLPILDSISNIASSVHGKVHEELLSHVTDEGDVEFSASQHDLLSLALDTVVALGNFVDRELVGGSGVVSVLEWDSFLRGLDQAVAPWMDYPRYDSANEGAGELDHQMPGILERAHLEIESLLLRLGALLDKCVRLESSPFHGVLDYEKQRRLYFFIFEKAIPHMDEMDAELLGLSVIRAWSRFGLYPYRHDDMGQTVTEILKAAFTRYEDGSYAHSARVRLEGLRALTRGDSESRGGFEDRGANNAATEAKNVASQLTLLSGTGTYEHQEQRSDVVDKAILPTLKAILMENEDNLPASWKKPIPRSKQMSFERGDSSFKNFGVVSALAEHNSFPLESFAVGLVGRMIRDAVGGREKAGFLVDILRSVALREIHGTTYEVGATVASGTADTLHERLRLQGSVRLEAVRELELCLSPPFGEQPKSHQIVPLLLDAFTAILIKCTDLHQNTITSHENAILSIASLIPLARLKLGEMGKLALLARVEVTKHIPGFLLPLLSLNERQPGFPSQTAPFILLRDNEADLPSDSSSSKDSAKSLVSLEQVMSSIVEALDKITNSRSKARVEIRHLQGTTVSLCLYALRSYVLSGYCLQNLTLISDFMFLATSERDDATSEECLAWVKMQAVLLQTIISNRLQNDASDAKGKLTGHELLELLLRAVDSKQPEESRAACRAIISVLPCLSRLEGKATGESIMGEIFTRILVGLENASVNKPTSVSDAVTVGFFETTSRLTLLYEVMNNAILELPSKGLSSLFEACVKVIAQLLKFPPTNCLYTAIKCIVATIDKLKLDDAIRIADENADFGFMEMDDVVSLDPAAELETPRAGFLEFLLSELLVQRIQRLRHEQQATSLQTLNKPVQHSTHEQLAKELEFMEGFPVDDGSAFSDSPKAAWLCGECVLLTCRIGSAKSRYRGWIEVVVRCPTMRKRIIVRLLSSLSLTNPEATSMLWAQPDSANGNPFPGSNSIKIGNLPSYDSKPSAAIDKATSVIARFDALFGTSGQDEIESQSEDFISELLPLPRVLPRQGGQQSETSASLLAASTVSSRLGETNAKNESRGEDFSIIGWLTRVFGGDKDKINDMKHALRRINFAEELIQSQGRELDLEPETASSSITANRLPIRPLQQGPRLDRAISVLDRTTPQNACKLALLYAGPRRIGKGGADPESMLLEARDCSPAYHHFSNGLGQMVPTRHLRYFSAGLDVTKYQSDGEFTRTWTGNDTSSLPAAMNIVVYHVVNLMPDGVNNRKRHVGNDNVLIVFVDKDSPIAMDVSVPDMEQEHPLVSGHFGFVTIYVTVMPQPNILRVTLQLRPGIPADLRKELLPFVGDDLIESDDAATYVRALAIRVDTVCRSLLDNLAPASNSHERYRLLREMNRHVIKKN